MAIAAFFLSCASTNKNVTLRSKKDYYKDNPYAQPYINNDYLFSGDSAMVYIHAFKNHNYRTFYKKKILDTAWSSFDKSILESVLKDQKTKSVYFLFAAYPHGERNIPKNKKRTPFIILQGIPKPDSSETGKGGVFSSAALSSPIYFLPVDICPPPKTGCTIPAPK